MRSEALPYFVFFLASVLSVTSLKLVAGQVTDKVSLILDFMFVLLDGNEYCCNVVGVSRSL